MCYLMLFEVICSFSIFLWQQPEIFAFDPNARCRCWSMLVRNKLSSTPSCGTPLRSMPRSLKEVEQLVAKMQKKLKDEAGIELHIDLQLVG